MAAAKDQGLAAWLKDLDSGKFKEAMGAKRSLGFKKTWSKADKAKAAAAIDKRFDKPAKVHAPAETEGSAPLTRETADWAHDANEVIARCKEIVATNRSALELMKDGLVPDDVNAAMVMGSNITRACLEMSTVIPNRPAATAKATTKGKKNQEPVEEEKNEDEDTPEKFRA